MKNCIFKERLTDYFKKIREDSIPYLASSSIVFTYDEEQIKILLIEFVGAEGMLKIPARAVFKNETLEESALLSVSEHLGIEPCSINQFHTFDIAEGQRHVTPEVQNYFSEVLTLEDLAILQQRLVVVGHYALVNRNNIKVHTTFPVRRANWYNCDDLDHLSLENYQKEFILKAREVLSQRLLYTPALNILLQQEFTLAELQKSIEVIACKNLDRGNFRKKVINSGKIVHVGFKERCCHRSPFLYRFEKDYHLL